MTTVEDLNLHILASSHLTLIDEAEKVRKTLRYGKEEAEKQGRLAAERFVEWCCGVNQVNTFSGLTLAPIEFEREGWGSLEHKSGLRVKQVADLKSRVKSASCKNFLFVGGSNDYKWFIVKDNKLVSLANHGREVWLRLDKEEKVNFNPRKHLVLDKVAEGFIFEKMKEFGEILTDIFRNSKCIRVFVSSILERRVPEEQNLEIYFAYINFFLKRLIYKLNKGGQMFNIDGEPIAWFFINVADQFHGSKNPESLFRRSEIIGKKGLTHRNIVSMKDIISKYLDEIRSQILQ